MGRDLCLVSNHQLPTENLEILAKALAERLHVNIEFGFLGDPDLSALLDIPGEDGIIISGSITRGSKLPTFKLIDENYLLKELYNKYGLDFFSLPVAQKYFSNSGEMMVSKQELINGLFGPSYELWKPDSETSNAGGHELFFAINRFFFTNLESYFCRWWDFCEIFRGYPSLLSHWSDTLEEFRNEIMHYTHLFGGDICFYLDDHSSAVTWIEGEMDLIQVNRVLLETMGDLVINIPKFFLDPLYRNSFLKTGSYPLAFKDDFSDLAK